jgi:hypothetical protein
MYQHLCIRVLIVHNFDVLITVLLEIQEEIVSVHYLAMIILILIRTGKRQRCVLINEISEGKYFLIKSVLKINVNCKRLQI